MAQPAAGCRASTRLGIPVTISSDPRHGFGENFAAAWAAAGFSQWPEPIGFGALRDEDVVREFGDIARREYRAVGIHVALHPMADLATEPRWARTIAHVRRGRRARRPARCCIHPRLPRATSSARRLSPA